MKGKKGLTGLNTALLVIGGVVGVIILAQILGVMTPLFITGVKAVNTSMVSSLGAAASSGLSNVTLTIFAIGAFVVLLTAPIYIFYKSKGGWG